MTGEHLREAVRPHLCEHTQPYVHTHVSATPRAPLACWEAATNCTNYADATIRSYTYERANQRSEDPSPFLGALDPDGNDAVLSQPSGFGEVDAEAVAVALVAPGHFRTGMAELLLHRAFVGCRGGGEAGAQ